MTTKLAVFVTAVGIAQATSAQIVVQSQGGLISATITGGTGQSTGLPPDSPFDMEVASSLDADGVGTVANGFSSARTGWSAGSVGFLGEIRSLNQVPASLNLSGVNQVISEASFFFTLAQPRMVRTQMGFTGGDTGGNIVRDFSFHFDRILDGGAHEIIYSGPVDAITTLQPGNYYLSAHGDTFMGLEAVENGQTFYELFATVTVVPAPASAAILGLALLRAQRRRGADVLGQ